MKPILYGNWMLCKLQPVLHKYFVQKCLSSPWCGCFHLWAVVIESSPCLPPPSEWYQSLEQVLKTLGNYEILCWVHVCGLFLEASQCPHVRMLKTFHLGYQCEMSVFMTYGPRGALLWVTKQNQKKLWLRIGLLILNSVQHINPTQVKVIYVIIVRIVAPQNQASLLKKKKTQIIN